jgi:hypothetical protein
MIRKIKFKSVISISLFISALTFSTGSNSQGLEQAFQNQKLSEFSSQEKNFIYETLNKFETYKKSVKNWFYCDGENLNNSPIILYFAVSLNNEILFGGNESFFMHKKPLIEFTENKKIDNSNEMVFITHKYTKKERDNVIFKTSGDNGFEAIREFKFKFNPDEKRKNDIVGAEYFYKPPSRVGEGNDRIYRANCTEISNLTRDQRIDNYLLIIDKNKKRIPALPKTFLVFDGNLVK